MGVSATHRSSSERCAARRGSHAQRDAALGDATGKEGVSVVGQVNQKIARHTQNSAAQWNLNSARTAELNSLQPTPAFLALTFVISLRALAFHLPSRSFCLSLSLVASYSLSFVIRRQTERRSCQVGGVGDETAVSVRPSFLHLHHRLPTGVALRLSLSPYVARSPYPYSHHTISIPTCYHIFRCVDGPPDSPLRLGTIMWPRKGGQYNSLPNAGRRGRALFRLLSLSSVLFTTRRNIPLGERRAKRERGREDIDKPDTRWRVSPLYDRRRFATRRNTIFELFTA